MKTSRFSKNISTNFLCRESEDWLIAALDPYHDYQYDVDGLPDERCAPSVVQIHNKTVTLTAPPISAGGNWDASVLYTGVNTLAVQPSSKMITVPGASIHHFSSNHISSGTSFGSLNCWAGAAGSTMSTGAPTTVGDFYSAIGSIDGSDRCRLIGVGFEIHNTTAEVYRQGSLTVAMLPDVAADSSNVGYYDTASDTWTTVQADRALIQASTVGPLTQVPGSQTWPAADGIYAIPRMSVVPRDVRTYGETPAPAVLGNAGASTRVPILYGTDGKIATPEPTGVHTHSIPTLQQALFKSSGPSGFSPIQVWFSGLSPQTSLTITLRTIVEYFPSLTSPLLPLSSPSPVYDPKALALYSFIAAEAPYAVPVNQNSAGDYFRKVMSVLGRGAQLLAPLFGPYAPIATTVGMAVESGAKLIRKDEAGSRAMVKAKTDRGKASRVKLMKM